MHGSRIRRSFAVYAAQDDGTVITVFNGFLGVDRDWDFIRDIETDERVLVGYSMGGRLALQALIEGAAFDRAVIVSAGLNLEEGREERRERDEAWAMRFESDEWENVMRDWNAQIGRAAWRGR